jgi:hypothetical protein
MGITYAPSSPGATPEAELDALSAIYRRAIERYEERQAADEDGGEEHGKPGRCVEAAQPDAG